MKDLTYDYAQIMQAAWKIGAYDVIASQTWDGKHFVMFSYAGFRFRVQDGKMYGQNEDYIESLTEKLVNAL